MGITIVLDGSLSTATASAYSAAVTVRSARSAGSSLSSVRRRKCAAGGVPPRTTGQRPSAAVSTKSDCGRLVEETATVFAVDRARRSRWRHRRAHDAPECGGLRGLVDGDEVGFLVEEHATGSQRGEHPPERLALVGKPLDQPARVHQIEAGRQVLDGDVVPQHLQGRGASRLLLEEVRLQVGRDDLAVRKDVLGEPNAIAPPPAPISRHRRPGPTPRRRRCARVPASSALSKPASRTRSWVHAWSYA